MGWLLLLLWLLPVGAFVLGAPIFFLGERLLLMASETLGEFEGSYFRTAFASKVCRVYVRMYLCMYLSARLCRMRMYELELGGDKGWAI